MINEVFLLAQAMEAAGISAPCWHREYKEIPNISDKAPCVRILIMNGKIRALESVPKESGNNIRKYGNNQGSFPAMNLTALYPIIDADKENMPEKKLFDKMLKEPGKYLDMEKIMQWCKGPDSTADNEDWHQGTNWTEKFQNKYAICMKKARELEEILGNPSQYEDAGTLIKETLAFERPKLLFDELKRAALDMLKKRENTKLALQILFCCEKKADGKDEKNEVNLSVVFDSDLLRNSTVGDRFAKKLNDVFMKTDTHSDTGSDVDAFHCAYIPSDDPMPSIKMAAGFDSIIRTMNTGAIPSLTRYGQKSNDTYPLSSENRTRISSALNWAASSENMGITWTYTGSKGEALFAYPSSIGTMQMPAVRLFGLQRSGHSDQRALFKHEAENFFDCVTQWKNTDPETFPKNIRIFILRKITKGQSKVVYTRQTDPDELIRKGSEWAKAAGNLPEIPYLPSPEIPFPLEISHMMNRCWRLDGIVLSGEFKPISSYHGVELQLDANREIVLRDLHLMGNTIGNLATYAGNILHARTRGKLQPRSEDELRETLVLLGMLLYWLGIRKDDYMESYAFLLGQLLKLADGLHELYCYQVRDKSLPQLLIGSSLYNAAAEMPAKTIAQLSQRLSPYIGWARTHRDARINEKSPSASYYEWALGQTTTKLAAVMTRQLRFDDIEKAELFIGYMAESPKSNKKEEDPMKESNREEKQCENIQNNETAKEDN